MIGRIDSAITPRRGGATSIPPCPLRFISPSLPVSDAPKSSRKSYPADASTITSASKTRNMTS
ncbi:MAG TPA: hypothetical protein DC059_03620 [Dietzia sp.]|nr:hypothetical protein [Dietzia sp.]